MCGDRPKIDPFNEKGLQIANQGCRFFKNVFGAKSTFSELKKLRLRRTSMRHPLGIHPFNTGQILFLM